MAKYRTRQAEIEAYCYNQQHDNSRPDWFQTLVSENRIVTFPKFAHLTETNTVINLGDWIVVYRSKVDVLTPDIFAASYEQVPDNG